MKWIDDIVLGLAESYGTNNVYELCDCLEIEIRKVEPTHVLLKGHGAFYYRYLDNKEIIFINKEMDPILFEFALKHELGHALCNTDILCAGFSNLNIGKYEKQANYFAFKLSNINFDEVQLEGMSIEQIASYVEFPLEPLKQLIEE